MELRRIIVILPWIGLAGPFILQMEWYPAQKLTMFTSPPASQKIMADSIKKPLEDGKKK